MPLTVLIYAQGIALSILLCMAAMPFFLLTLLFVFPFRRTREMIFRTAVLIYGKCALKFVWPYVRIKFEDSAPEEDCLGLCVFNHRSASDPFLVAAAVGMHPPIQGVNRWPMRLPFFGFFARGAGYIGVLDTPRDEVTRRVAEAVEEGSPVAVFPEGTRSGGRTMNQFNGLFFRAAQDAGCRIIPFAVVGNENIPDRSFRMSCGTVTIRKLPSLSVEEVRSMKPYALKNLVRKIIFEETVKMEMSA